MTLHRPQASRHAPLLASVAFALAVLAPVTQAQGTQTQDNARPKAFEKRIAALEELAAIQSAAIAALRTALDSEIAARGAYAARVGALEGKTQDMSRVVDPNTGKNTVRFSAVNVQVVNGSGLRDGPVNGVGNLIVGYNVFRGGGLDVRTGSHNLVVGDLNNYTSFGGLLAGIFNTVSGQYGSVTAGNVNTASGIASSVAGGRFNTASFDYASVSGGSDNEASSYAASVSGGFERKATGFYDWRAGGMAEDF